MPHSHMSVIEILKVLARTSINIPSLHSPIGGWCPISELPEPIRNYQESHGMDQFERLVDAKDDEGVVRFELKEHRLFGVFVRAVRKHRAIVDLDLPPGGFFEEVGIPEREVGV